MLKKFTKWIVSAFIIVLFGVTGFSTAFAVKPVDTGIVMGEYYFVATFTRVDTDTGILDHCSAFGTLEFDGEGSVNMRGTERCDDSDSSIGSFEHPRDYEVTDERVVKIHEPEPEDGYTECQAVNRGDTLLCHGIYRAADHLNFMAVAERAD